MKFLFYIVDANWRCGGTMVLHELSKILSDLGQDVYMTVTNAKFLENNSKIINQNEAIQLAAADDCVTIYPEVVSGNPFCAKNVVRWVLYYPGGWGKGDTIFDESEYVFTYSKKFVKNTIYKDSPCLTIFKSNLDKFYDNSTERKYDAVLLKKGQFRNLHEIKAKHFDPHVNILNKQFLNFDNVIRDVVELEQLNAILNQVRYFVSFDQDTYHNILAALAGCISVVIPVDGITDQDWKNNSEVCNYGIAYGFEDLPWVFKTQNKIRQHIQNLEQKNITFAQNFINLTKQKWNIH